MKSYPFLSHLSSFAGRAVVFFFLIMLMLVFFFILGNWQDFLDSTQHSILSAIRISLGMELICGVYFAVFLTNRCITEHRSFVVRWILLGLSLVFCGCLLVALRYMQAWLQG